MSSTLQSTPTPTVATLLESLQQYHEAGLTEALQAQSLPDVMSQSTEDDGVMVTRNMTMGIIYTDKFDSRLTWYEDYIVGSLLLIVGILSLFGNGSCCVMFWRRYKQLTPAELLLLNLAVIHLVLALCSYPASMYSSFNHRWSFADLGCQLYAFVCYLIGIATMVSTMALAIVRYLKTCTHNYSRKLTTGHIKITLVGVYLYSVFWAILPFFPAISQYEVEPFGTSCTLNWANPSAANKIYIVLAVTFVVVIPYIIMIWCYCRIILLVRRNRLKKTIMGKKSANSQAPSQLQLTIVSALVCFGYLIAWCPYAIVSVTYGLGGLHAPVYVSLIPVLLAKSSCAYNPIIYIFITARYRKEMLKIIQEKTSWFTCCFRYPSRESNMDDGSFSEVVQSSSVRIPLEVVTPKRKNPKTILQTSYCESILEKDEIAVKGKSTNDRPPSVPIEIVNSSVNMECKMEKPVQDFNDSPLSINSVKLLEVNEAIDSHQNEKQLIQQSHYNDSYPLKDSSSSDNEVTACAKLDNNLSKTTQKNYDTPEIVQMSKISPQELIHPLYQNMPRLNDLNADSQEVNCKGSLNGAEFTLPIAQRHGNEDSIYHGIRNSSNSSIIPVVSCDKLHLPKGSNSVVTKTTSSPDFGMVVTIPSKEELAAISLNSQTTLSHVDDQIQYEAICTNQQSSSSNEHTSIAITSNMDKLPDKIVVDSLISPSLHDTLLVTEPSAEHQEVGNWSLTNYVDNKQAHVQTMSELSADGDILMSTCSSDEMEDDGSVESMVI